MKKASEVYLITDMKVSNEELLNELQRLFKESKEGKVTYQNMENKGDFSGGIYTYRFDSWNNALIEAGIPINQKRGYTEEEIINEIKRVSELYFNSESFTRREMDKKAKLSSNICSDVFGTWNEALSKAGLQYNEMKNIPKEELIKDIQNISKQYCNGERPTIGEFRKFGKYNYHPYEREFGSWNEAVEAAGFTSFEMPSGEDSWNWEGGCVEYYGENWGHKRQNIIERDDGGCRLCNKKTFINETPDVHHITPARYWDVEKEYEQMNHERNLICLCRQCHHKTEGKFKGRNHEEFEKLAKEHFDIDVQAEGYAEVATRSVFDY